MKVRTDIKFTWARHKYSNHGFRVGVGPDGSLWVPAAFLRLTDATLELYQRTYGQVVLVDADDGIVYVDARAVVMNCPVPAVREILERDLAKLVKSLFPKMFPGETAAKTRFYEN